MAYAMPGVREALNVAIVIRSIDKFSRTFDLAQTQLGGMRQKYGALVGTISTLFDKVTLGISGFMLLISVIIKCTKAVTEFEWRLVELRKVYMGTDAEIDQRIIPGIKELGETYGMMADDVTDAMVRWAQQGKQGAELQELTESSIRFTMVAMVDQAQATEYLTAAINQYQLTADDTNDVIATWNWLANTQMVTAGYLGEAITDVGTTAKQFGMTLDETSVLLTLLSRAGFQAGEAGKGLNMILMKMYRTPAIKALAAVGVAVMDANGNFREADEILGELAGKWENLTDLQRKNIMEQVAGGRHAVKLNILMEQWGDTAGMLADKEEMLAKAQEEVNRTLETAHKQWEIAQSKIHNLTLEIGKGFLPVSALLAKSVSGFVDAISLAYEDLGKFYGWIKDIAGVSEDAYDALEGMGASTEDIIALKDEFGEATDDMELSLEDFQKKLDEIRESELDYAEDYANALENMRAADDLRNAQIAANMQAREEQIAQQERLAKNMRDILELMDLDYFYRLRGDKTYAEGILAYQEYEKKRLNPYITLLEKINWLLEKYLKYLKKIKDYEAAGIPIRGGIKPKGISPEEITEKESTWLQNIYDRIFKPGGLRGARAQTGRTVGMRGEYELGENPLEPEFVGRVNHWGGINITISGVNDPDKIVDLVLKKLKYKLRGRGGIL